MEMHMTYAQLLRASLSDIETIRIQPEAYSRIALTPAELDALWHYLDTLYVNKVQRGFAQRIYMKAA